MKKICGEKTLKLSCCTKKVLKFNVIVKKEDYGRKTKTRQK